MNELATSSSPLCRVAELDPGTRSEMRGLFAHTYSDVTYFDTDLEDKDWALLVRAESGELTGFSTLKKYPAELDGVSVTVFFSGDTVVHPAHRNKPDLARLWGREVFAMVAREKRPCWWFLICSGFRTYRFLPVFYKEFYPRYDRPTPPDLQRFLDALAIQRFGPLYHNGIVSLQVGCREPLPDRKLDPHAQFFLSRNPGWRDGHELACLTRLDAGNQTAATQRLLRA